jgi:hypothetical protein
MITFLFTFFSYLSYLFYRLKYDKLILLGITSRSKDIYNILQYDFSVTDLVLENGTQKRGFHFQKVQKTL